MIQGITAIGFIVLFAIYAEGCLPAVGESINMFFTRVMPSIFPFYVAANILMASPLCVKAAEKLTPVTKKLFGLRGSAGIAIFVGFISGYPAGAKVTADLYKNGLISRKEAYTLSAFTSNCGPLFIIGTVGAGMLGNSTLGIILWLIHISAAFIIGLIFRCREKNHRTASSDHVSLSPGKKQGLSPCITDAMMSMIPIAGAIVFFSAFIALLDALSIIPQSLSPLAGIIEITTGIARTVSMQGLSPLLKMCIVSATSGWAGISVHIQVAGILSDAGLSSKKYLMGKLCHTVLAVALTLSFFCFHPIP